MRPLARVILIALITFVTTAHCAFAQSQSNAADLQGYVRDAQGAVVAGANVTARNKATSLERTATSNDEGFYKIVNLPPGDYEVNVQAANFSKANIPSVTITVGQRADLDIPLAAGQLSETVTVSDASTQIVETSRTAVANTIDRQRIENLPVNQRDYLGIATTISSVNRGNDRPIGPAPTSGLNIGGQRGRSTLVQVDGADNTDNSINAARSTVSQEAVQEFQVVTNSYAPEFGRAIGGIVNVVTKGGTNDLHGNAFGFLRHKSIQARNAFAPIIDNDPGKKPPYTRTQSGFTLGGPFDRDRTFFFVSYERRQRNESGFFTGNVAGGLNGVVSVGPGTALPAPIPFPVTFRNLTGQQANFITSQLQSGLSTGNAALINSVLTYAYEVSGGGSTALTGTNPLVSLGGAIPAGQVIGSRFFLSGAPVPVGTVNAQGVPIAFRPLLNLQSIFPVTERTNFSSARLDHKITDRHLLTMRFGYNPSDITGIQVESQNQSLGQNDFSRTGLQKLRDTAFVTSLNSTLSNSIVNEGRFSFSERRAVFTSQNPDAVAFNISGAAFIGRELFSPVNRTETRYQYTDNVNWVVGGHTFKFGGDANFVNVSAIFELNFAGLFNFGTTDIRPFVPGSSVLPLAPCASSTATGCTPLATPVQAYGLGLPANFIQGFGNPASRLSNKPLAWFAQDSWKVRRNLTFNYGVRYDIELTQQIAPVGFSDPLSGITLSAADILAAQDAVGVQQGFPRDKNNWAPRVGVAWDITGDAKTVVRASYGLFYDHPLLAIGFNSDIADAAQQQQGILTPGSPAPTALLNAVQVFQGTIIPCTGTLVPGVSCTPGVARSATYQFGRQRFDDQTFPGFGPVLPFTLPVAKDFQYAYANQANLTVERQLTKDMSLTASYLFVGAHHLPHPLDINAPRIDLQIANFVRCTGRQPVNTTEASSVSPSACTNIVAQPIPGLVSVTTRGAVIAPAAANFFRPSGPNYFLVQALTNGAVTPAVLNSVLTATGTLERPGVISPYGSINAQSSDGNSNYNALDLSLRRRFANNFTFLANYTWSHAIDDSSDLQTLLLPQDNRNFRAERADSLFDQRHRFVFSGVVSAPAGYAKEGGIRRLLADFTVAPIIEISSGRPFNIITNTDTNNDQSTQTDRPNVASDGTLLLPPDFTSGSLGRNRGITHRFASFDLRVTRAVRFGERVRLDLIAEGFNLFNRFNEVSASPFFQDVNAFNQRDSSGRYFSIPTAAADPRQFQLGLKLNF
jgi:hypothetical protein